MTQNMILSNLSHMSTCMIHAATVAVSSRAQLTSRVAHPPQPQPNYLDVDPRINPVIPQLP